jgi:hypothetical protein
MKLNNHSITGLPRATADAVADSAVPWTSQEAIVINRFFDVSDRRP